LSQVGHTGNVTAWAMGMAALTLVVIAYPVGLLCVIIFAASRVKEDREKRDNAEIKWATLWDDKRKVFYFYNIETEETSLEPPAELTPGVKGPQARPWEERWGCDGLLGGLHCRSTISACYPLFGVLTVCVQSLLAMESHCQGQTWGMFALCGAAAVEALFFSMAMPLIDESLSEKNVENYATAVSLWLLAASMLCSALDASGSVAQWLDSPALQMIFQVLSMLATQAVPVGLLVDKYYLGKPDEKEEEEETGSGSPPLYVEDEGHLSQTDQTLMSGEKFEACLPVPSFSHATTCGLSHSGAHVTAHSRACGPESTTFSVFDGCSRVSRHHDGCLQVEDVQVPPTIVPSLWT